MDEEMDSNTQHKILIDQINPTNKILVVKPIVPTHKTHKVMQSRLRKRPTESVHTNRSTAHVSHVVHVQHYSNRGGRWKHKCTMKWSLQNDKKKIWKLNLKYKCTVLKKKVRSQDLGLIVNICKALGLVQTSAHISTLEPHYDIQMSHTNREALRPSKRAIHLYSSLERHQALPTITHL